MKELLENKITVLIALLISLLISYILWYVSYNYYQERAKNKFKQNAHTVIENIEKRMIIYENVLRGGVALYQASHEIDRSEWHQFVKTIGIKQYYPGIQGIGISLMLKPDEVASLEKKMRDEGYENYILNPKGERDLYSAITYLEPLDERNVKAIGYDMFSEAIRKEAMIKARDTGLPAISGRVTLVQEIDSDVQAGILLYLPFYKKNMPLNSVEERREAHIGYIYSPFRMGDLMKPALGEDSFVHVELYDDIVKSEENLLYESLDNHRYSSKYYYEEKLNFGQRPWSCYLHSTEEFDLSMENEVPIILAIAGLLLSISIFIILISLYNRRRVLSELVDLRTKELYDLNKNLESRIEEAIQNIKKKDDMLIIQSRSAAMGEMISMIAHQWRQPLSIISTKLNTISIKNELNTLKTETLTDEVKEIDSYVQHLSKTIDDFRNFFLPKKNMKEVLISELMNKALDIIQYSLKNNNIEYTINFKDVTMVKVYSRELIQVFISILKNAEDALLESERKDKHIKIDIEEDNDNIIINICNNGGQIKEENINKIFEPYFSTKENLNGTGLGLYMCKMIIEKHSNAHLTVHNIEDGVCFTIKILSKKS